MTGASLRGAAAAASATAAAASSRLRRHPRRYWGVPAGPLPPASAAGLVASSPLLSPTGRAGPAMADFDEIYEEEEDEERALEEQLLKYSPDPVVVRGSGHVTV